MKTKPTTDLTDLTETAKSTETRFTAAPVSIQADSIDLGDVEAETIEAFRKVHKAMQSGAPDITPVHPPAVKNAREKTGGKITKITE